MLWDYNTLLQIDTMVWVSERIAMSNVATSSSSLRLRERERKNQREEMSSLQNFQVDWKIGCCSCQKDIHVYIYIYIPEESNAAARD